MNAAETATMLAHLLNEEGLHELTLETGEQSLRLRRRAPALLASAPEEEPEPSLEESMEEAQAVVVRSQVVGLMHLSDHLGGDPLVRAGERVEQGRVLGFVESMSINHEVVASSAGSVVEILVHEGDPVEYGQALMILFPEGGG